MKEKIEAAFAKLYPGKRLLAAKINDMHISVWFDDGHEEGWSGQDGVTQDSYEFWTNNYQGKMNELKEEVQVGPYSYWHDCWTHTWIQPWER